MSFVSRNLLKGVAVALLGAALGACAKGNSNLPNDPLTALVCDTGYILSPSRSNCIPETIVVVHGVLTDSKTGLQVPGVNVSVQPFAKTTTTDANGYFMVRGGTTADTIIVSFSSTDYQFKALTLRKDRSDYEIAGDIVLDGSTSLVRLARQLTVAGTVYAGDLPANQAAVTLYDTGIGVETYSAQTDSSGHFSISNVRSGSYDLRVYPFDENSDGVTDYRFSTTALGNIGTTTTVNITNIVVPLVAIKKGIDYTSLIGSVAYPITASGTFTDLRINSPTSPILIQFGAEVDTSSVSVGLMAFNTSDSTYGAPLAVTTAWTNGNTVLTITPSAALSADANATTAYALRINSLFWYDGSILLAQNTPGTFIEFEFDVSTAPTLLASPTPAIYIDRKEDLALAAKQTKGTGTDAFKCDAFGCWVLAADGYPVSGWGGGVGAAAGAMNETTGFDLSWTRVAGAVAYHVYARRSSTAAEQVNYANWYLMHSAIDVTPVDPGFTQNIDAIALDTFVGFANDWATLDFGGVLGTLGGGAGVDIAVTAVDAAGFESTLDVTKLLHLTDTLPAITTSWTIADPTVERGTTQIHRDVTLAFSEPMIAGADPVIASQGGNITAVSAAPNGSWRHSLLPTFENTATAWDGTVSFKVRGGCTPITCDGFGPRNGSSNSASSSVCVKDSSLFTTGTVIFVNNAGALMLGTQAAPALTNVDATNGVLTFGSNFVAPLLVTDNVLACVGSAVANNVAYLTAIDTVTTIISVNDNKIFYPGERVLLYGTVTPSTQVMTVVRLRANNSLEVSAGVSNVAFPPGSSTVLMPFYDGEYALRGTTPNLVIRKDATAAATTITLDFEQGVGQFDGENVMIGDLCAVDVDGVSDTIGDRYFGRVSSVIMTPDVTADGTDNAVFQLMLDATTGRLPAIPSGAGLRRTISTIQCLGDSLQLTNADPASTSALTDTSANKGLLLWGDQYSSCASGFLCGKIAASQAIY